MQLPGHVGSLAVTSRWRRQAGWPGLHVVTRPSPPLQAVCTAVLQDSENSGAVLVTTETCREDGYTLSGV